MTTTFAFQNEFPFERRAAVAAQIRAANPSRVPIIVEKDPNSIVPYCTKRKFLVPEEITIGALMFEIRRHISGLSPEQAIFLFVASQLPESGLSTSHKTNFLCLIRCNSISSF
eukprot:TRINITY_DN1632_c0_g2_i3.p1 TRINITY_DN1632_c0_g2~~TRINITY_DN1632_c0_g2_i3.p1  ORF type:complete len:113 (+),score=14.60 TRINITY_DN1632_c0_g2_i3:92-430(+)